MTIGVLKLFLLIQESNSLETKRMVLQSLKVRLRNNFNVALTQIDDGDKWQRAALAVVGVGKESSNVNSQLSNVVNFVERCKSVDLIDYVIELI